MEKRDTLASSMQWTAQHLDLEKRFRKLIGLTVLNVRYNEINYEPEHPVPNYHTRFSQLHSVDFSLFLYTDTNQLIEIHWDDQFYQFDIGLKINEPSDFTGGISWNVSEELLWKSVINEKIIDIELIWESVSELGASNDETPHSVYLQTVRITFSNAKKVLISTADFLNQDDTTVQRASDNLLITDNEELAAQLNILTGYE